MVAEVYAGIGAFKAMFDMAKGLKDIHDTTIRNGAIIELQEQILSAQAQQSELIDRLRALEKEIAEAKTWETEKRRYQLEQLPPGSFALALKPEFSGGEPPHYICQTCFQRGKKSILHADEHYNGIHHLSCCECSTKLQVGHFVAPQVMHSYRDT
ncbi:MAG TPA: hypothetical protein VIM52_02200 [Stellaceae bacterium]